MNTEVSGLQQLKINRETKAKVKTFPWKKWALVAIPIGLVIAWSLKPSVPEVKTSSVISTTLSQQYVQLSASGYVVAQRRAAVASKATGRLLELFVREGSVVKKNDLIARLDASDIEASKAQAIAAIRQAEANAAQATVEVQNAEAELRRLNGLKAQGFVSAQALENGQFRLKSAQSVYKAAQASIGVAQAQLKIQQVNQNFTEIRAPFDGVVLVKNANVGDIITPFSNAAGSQGAVVTMADMSTLEVEADVSESNLAKVKNGQPVEITLDALPDQRFNGNINSIVPTVDRAKATVMTKIRFEQLDPKILPEMSAKVSFLSQAVTPADQQSVLAVNPACIQKTSTGNQVWRLNGEVIEAVDVSTGRKLGEQVEITGKLKSGDKIIMNPTDKFKAGMKVSVVNK